MSSDGDLALSADSLPGDNDADNNFIDSIGVNLKLNSYSRVYQNYALVKSRLLELGVRHIRDGFRIPNSTQFENELTDLSHYGIRSVLGLTITPDRDNKAIVNITGSQAIAYLRAGHYASSIEAVEGINEPDVNQTAPDGPSPTGWAAAARETQEELAASMHAMTARKQIPIYGPSVRIDPARLRDIGDLSAFMDVGNIHNYSGGYDLAGSTIDKAVSMERSLSGNKPVIATGNGYASGTTGQGLPESVMLDYTQRLFFKQFTHNVKRTFWYELLDENSTPNDYWHNSGMLRSDLTQKPCFIGLKNIIALLEDRTKYRPRTKLRYSFGGQTQFENIEHLLLQKNDGSFWLVVWRDVAEWNPARNGSTGSFPDPLPTSVPNSLNFLDSYINNVTEFDEDDAGRVTSLPIPVISGTTAEISIGPRPRIFRIIPGILRAQPNAPVLPGTVAHFSLDEGAGNVAADSLSSAGSLALPANGKIAWSSGKFRDSLLFDGTEATSTVNFINTDHSYAMSAWVQLNNLSKYQAALSINGIRQAAVALDYTPQSNLSLTMYSSDDARAGGTRIGSTFKPVIGQWYSVVGTFDATTRIMTFYVDGKFQGHAVIKKAFDGIGGFAVGSMKQAGIGYWQWWNGAVDEVNLYQRTLSADEVRSLAAF